MFRRKKKADGKTPDKKKPKAVELFPQEQHERTDNGGDHEDHEDKHRDKIFNNDYNTGNIKVENFGEIKIDTANPLTNMDDCYNSDEYEERMKLMNMVYEVFKKSQWGNLPLNKKFSKDLMPFIFNDLFKGVDGQGFTTTDIFICITEFMDITYERVYEIAPLRMKERLINELEGKYKILSKKNIKRLF